MALLLRLEQQQKDFRIRIFLFFSHLELKRYIRSFTPVVLSKTIPDSRQKWSKPRTRFQTKTAQKPHPLALGRRIGYMAYISEYHLRV